MNMNMNLFLFFFFISFLLTTSQTHAKAVFAHFMVGNVPSFTITDWEKDISLASSSSIDAFALNIASNDTSNTNSLSNAFKAANTRNFKLFFSFDYAATGPWQLTSVLSLLTQYAHNPAYFQHNNKPLVSTFEGPSHSSDWTTIKSQIDCFFIPDYSSLGAQAAMDTGVADGLFSWDAWPQGPSSKTTATDQLYKSVLDGRPYMMPVSPWFYTNLPGFDKNWLWRGDSLWFDRWQQVLEIDPEFVQIISWNDYGESHYVGPLYESGFGLFAAGSAPFNYVRNMDHEGWRRFLPFVIGRYRNGVGGVDSEGLVVWYRVNPGRGCLSGGTRGGSEKNGEESYEAYVVSEDKIFYSALLSSFGNVSVTVGGVVVGGGGWERRGEGGEEGGEGIYFGSVGFEGRSGEVSVSVVRGSDVVAKMVGADISSVCEKNLVNWNAWVGSS